MNPVPSCPVGWFRALLAAFVVAISLLLVSPVAAQDESEVVEDPEPAEVTVLDDEEEAQPESAIVRDDDTSETVRRIRRDLVIVAGVMTAALVVYVWHTSSSRRLRIASDRADTLLDQD